MLKILAYDDEQEFLNILKDLLDRNLKIAYTLEATGSAGRLEDYLKEEGKETDVLLMDIKLQGIQGAENGIDLAGRIMKQFKRLKIIFITGYSGQYMESIFLKLHPYGIINKPIKEQVLCSLLEKAELEKRQESRQEFLTLKVQSGMVRISVDELKYAESLKRQVVLHLDKEELTCYLSLKQLQEQLPEKFLHCHKSFLVNMDWIVKFSSREIILEDQTVINVSKSKAAEARTKYFTYMGLGI